MATLRLRLDPFVERSVKTRHALEPPWSSAVSVRYNTPCTPKGTGWTAGVHIPVDEPLAGVLGLVLPHRRLHTRPVHRHPQLLVPPNFGKGLMDPGMLPIVPQRLVLVNFHNPSRRNGRRAVTLARIGLVQVPLLPILPVDLQKVQMASTVASRFSCGTASCTTTYPFSSQKAQSCLLRTAKITHFAYTFQNV